MFVFADLVVHVCRGDTRVARISQEGDTSVAPTTPGFALALTIEGKLSEAKSWTMIWAVDQSTKGSCRCASRFSPSSASRLYFTLAYKTADSLCGRERNFDRNASSLGQRDKRVDIRSDAQKEAASIHVPLYRFGHVDEARIAPLSTSQFGNVLRRSRRVNPMR